MIVHYNKITPEHRSLVRSIESKAYIAYLRYLLLKRWPFERVRRELIRLGLSWNEQEDVETYFREVLYPIIKKYNLTKYYKKYRYGMSDSPLLYSETFGSSEKDRVLFIDLINHLEVTQFFSEEIMEFYGGTTNIPNHPHTGEPLIAKEKPVDLVELLQNPKRHVIENLLIEGYSPKQISEYLFQRFDMELSAKEIKMYAKSFFNVKRQDIQNLLDSFQTEKESLEKRLTEIRHMSASAFSHGERFEITKNISDKINELNRMIGKLNSVHTSASYNTAVLEVSDMREMFSDVMVRAHRRFRDMDERTEDEVVSPLNSIVSMMSKATDKIMGIDDLLNQKSDKSINEEILDVVIPTLERIEEEEREAMYAYKNSYEADKSADYEDDDNDILGFDH